MWSQNSDRYILQLTNSIIVTYHTMRSDGVCTRTYHHRKHYNDAWCHVLVQNLLFSSNTGNPRYCRDIWSHAMALPTEGITKTTFCSCTRSLCHQMVPISYLFPVYQWPHFKTVQQFEGSAARKPDFCICAHHYNILVTRKDRVSQNNTWCVYSKRRLLTIWTVLC